MSWPVYRGADGRYAVALDHVPDEAVALEADLAHARETAERLNADALPAFAGAADAAQAASAPPSVAAATAA